MQKTLALLGLILGLAVQGSPLYAAPAQSSNSIVVCNSPAVTASAAYGTNYVVGGVQTFLNVLQPNTKSGVLQDVWVTMLDQETSGFTFFPFSSLPSNSSILNDNAVASLAAGDIPKLHGGPIPLASNIQMKSTVFSMQYAYGLGITIAPGTQNLYGVLLANAALTNNFAGASDIQVCIAVMQDF